MDALKWLKSKFFVNEDNDEFWFGQQNCSSSITVFLACFGNVIDTALSEGRNPVDDLCALPEIEKRGWGSVFDEWKTRGL